MEGWIDGSDAKCNLALHGIIPCYWKWGTVRNFVSDSELSIFGRYRGIRICGRFIRHSYFTAGSALLLYICCAYWGWAWHIKLDSVRYIRSGLWFRHWRTNLHVIAVPFLLLGNSLLHVVPRVMVKEELTIHYGNYSSTQMISLAGTRCINRVSKPFHLINIITFFMSRSPWMHDICCWGSCAPHSRFYLTIQFQTHQMFWSLSFCPRWIFINIPGSFQHR